MKIFNKKSSVRITESLFKGNSPSSSFCLSDERKQLTLLLPEMLGGHSLLGVDGHGVN